MKTNQIIPSVCESDCGTKKTLREAKQRTLSFDLLCSCVSHSKEKFIKQIFHDLLQITLLMFHVSFFLSVIFIITSFH